MDLFSAVVLLLYLFQAALGGIINHDQVQPFAQPEPVTVSEKAAVKYKPQLRIGFGCSSFPAVNAAGEITGGLKGSKGADGCAEAAMGSQVYGRSTWYQDRWAMMFAWYFPKNFREGDAVSRHYWANMVVWIDNPALETATILGVSTSRQNGPKKIAGISTGKTLGEPYDKTTKIDPTEFVGAQRIIERISRRNHNVTVVGGSNVSLRVVNMYFQDNACLFPKCRTWFGLARAQEDGQYQDLIMWNQLPDQARAALETADFEEAQVPFNDKNFEAKLREAWPF